MRLMVTANHKPSSLNSIYYNALCNMGIKVKPTYCLEEADKIRSRNFITKIRHKINYNWTYKSCNKLLLEDISLYKPDVFFVFKGMELYPETLEKLHNIGITLVNYNADHPFDYVGSGSGNRNVMKGVKHYDIHITYSELIAEELRFKCPHSRVEIIPFGFDSKNIDFGNIQNIKEVNKVCFVGNPDQRRINLIKYLIAKNIEIDVYGNNWNRYLKESQYLRLFPQVIGLNYYKILRAYRVQLNVFRDHNFGSHNMRTFEVPAVGGILLSPYSDQQTKFFRPEKEMFFYSTYDEAYNKIMKLLNLSKHEQVTIRLNARKRSLDDDYSYLRRTRDLVQLISKVNI